MVTKTSSFGLSVNAHLRDIDAVDSTASPDRGLREDCCLITHRRQGIAALYESHPASIKLPELPRQTWLCRNISTSMLMESESGDKDCKVKKSKTDYLSVQ